MEILITKIKDILSLSQKAEKYLYTISKVKTFPKGRVLIKQGQQVNKIFCIIDGCLRSFCIDSNGKEHTLQFGIKEWWISDYIAVYNNEPAVLTVECLKDSTVVVFDAQKLNGIYAFFPEFEVFQRNLLQRHVVSLHKRILNQLQLTASERYDLFLEQYPDIEQFTRNYHIASYLGITTESLSRIRKERTNR